VDLPMPVGVIAERDHVGSGREQLIGHLRRDAHPACGVLPVDDHERGRVALAQRRKQRRERPAADAADDIAYEQDAGLFDHVCRALIGLWALARAAGPVLLILVAASTAALILNPLIKRLQRAGIHRGLAIFLVYVAMFAALIGIGILLANPISTQVNRFAKDVPNF